MKGSYRVAFAIVLCTAPVASVVAQARQQTAAPRYATKSRDIGGFTLGMSIREATKLAPVEALGNDDFQALRDGISYDFGVTPKGRVYRISSSQPLGHFSIDRTFLDDLATKLVAKYGMPSGRTTSTFDWDLVETVQRDDGQALPFKTMWASAYIDDGASGVTVHMKMIDFRILWADQDALNRKPREHASGTLAF
jgi:hypothetical protein